MGRSEFTPFGAPENKRRNTTPLLIASGALALVVVSFSLGRVTISQDSDSEEGSEQEQEEQAESSEAPEDEEVTTEGQIFSSDDLTWRDHGGAMVPFSSEHGPHEDQGGWVREFDRTPQGAVLAGAQIYMQASVTADLPEEAIEQSLRNQLTGEHAPSYVEETLEDDFSYDPNREYTKVEAYNIHEYDENNAGFELVIANLDPDTEEVAIRVALVVAMGWRDGDWRLHMPENVLDETRILDNLEGFEIFPGVDVDVDG